MILLQSWELKKYQTFSDKNSEKKWRLVQDATNLSIKKDKVNQQMADKDLIGGKYTANLSNLQVF